MPVDDTHDLSRRSVLGGIGGMAAMSLSGATAAEVQEALTDRVPSDPHTLDTYRAVVDAILPRTPELADELGEEFVPGGLEMALERFVIWDFNHFQEIRREMLATPVAAHTEIEDATGGPSAVGVPGADHAIDPDRFALDLDATAADSPFGSLAALADPDGLDRVGDVTALERHLDFGTLHRLEQSIADAPVAPGATGPADVELLVETVDETVHRVVQNYQYAPVFAVAFDVLAAEFLARGRNHEDPAPRPEFPAGGTFVRLSRRDRLRMLWDVVDGGALDRIDGLLSPVVPYLGILKYVVMAINGLTGFGYYTEWSGYGDTRTAAPGDRELQVPAGATIGRQQTGYPGPAPGHAADWYHLVPGSFSDNPDAGGGDLRGEDVRFGGGSDAGP